MQAPCCMVLTLTNHLSFKSMLPTWALQQYSARHNATGEYHTTPRNNSQEEELYATVQKECLACNSRRYLALQYIPHGSCLHCTDGSPVSHVSRSHKIHQQPTDPLGSPHAAISVWSSPADGLSRHGSLGWPINFAARQWGRDVRELQDGVLWPDWRPSVSSGVNWRETCQPLTLDLDQYN